MQQSRISLRKFLRKKNTKKILRFGFGEWTKDKIQIHCLSTLKLQQIGLTMSTVSKDLEKDWIMNPRSKICRWKRAISLLQRSEVSRKDGFYKQIQRRNVKDVMTQQNSNSHANARRFLIALLNANRKIKDSIFACVPTLNFNN